MKLFENASYDFLGWRRPAYIISGVLLLVGVISIVLHGGLRYGVEFTGGTLLQLAFDAPTEVANIRATVADAGFRDAQIQQFGSPTEFIVRVAEFQEGSDSSVRDAVSAALTDAYGDGWTLARTAALSPRVGQELQRNAMIAVVIALAATMVYLAFRFEWRFGVAAAIAVGHDVAVTVGFISLVNIEMSLTIIAALLTIVGYSLNDTIVVFDRIRDNLKKHRKMNYVDLVNRSINETLPRTVLTGPTTLFTLLALYVIGGEVIAPFALVLIVGIILGTFSSIFVASAILLEIENRSGHATESAKKSR